MLITMFLLQTAGFLLLALSQKHHHRQIMHRALAPSRQRAFRIAGFALLAVSFGIGLQAEGAQFGPVWWLAAASMTALLVLALSSLRARNEPTGR